MCEWVQPEFASEFVTKQMQIIALFIHKFMNFIWPSDKNT